MLSVAEASSDHKLVGSQLVLCHIGDACAVCQHGSSGHSSHCITVPNLQVSSNKEQCTGDDGADAQQQRGAC